MNQPVGGMGKSWAQLALLPVFCSHLSHIISPTLITKPSVTKKEEEEEEVVVDVEGGRGEEGRGERAYTITDLT